MVSVGGHIQVRCSGYTCVSTMLRCARHSPQFEKLPQEKYAVVPVLKWMMDDACNLPLHTEGLA